MHYKLNKLNIILNVLFKFKINNKKTKKKSKINIFNFNNIYKLKLFLKILFKILK